MSTALSVVRANIALQEQTLRDIIPANTIDYTRFMARAYQQLEKCKDADPASMVLAVIQCASLGLEPGTQAHFVEFWDGKDQKKKIQLIADYKGVIAIAVRSGAIRGAEGRIICENDEFEWVEGDSPKLHHKPKLTGQGKRVAAYVRFQMPDGSYRFEVIRENELAAVRSKSKAKSGPWFEFEDEMAKKTAAKRALKWMQSGSIDARELNYLQQWDDVPQAASKKVTLTDKDGNEVAFDMPEEVKGIQSAKKTFYDWYLTQKDHLTEEQRKAIKQGYEAATALADLTSMKDQINEWITFNQSQQNGE